MVKKNRFYGKSLGQMFMEIVSLIKYSYCKLAELEENSNLKNAGAKSIGRALENKAEPKEKKDKF